MADANQANKLRGELEKVLDRIASDPTYRQQLLDNPRAVLAATVGVDLEGDVPEVAGYAKCTPGGTCSSTMGCAPAGTCSSTCGQSCTTSPNYTCGYASCTSTKK